MWQQAPPPLKDSPLPRGGLPGCSRKDTGTVYARARVGGGSHGKAMRPIAIARDTSSGASVVLGGGPPPSCVEDRPRGSGAGNNLLGFRGVLTHAGRTIGLPPRLTFHLQWLFA
jgi:hypothetical protein